MRSQRFIVLVLLLLTLLAALAQLVIDTSSENAAAVSLVAASSAVVLLYILWTQAIQTHPLSTFAIFGFCVTSQMGALLAQSASGASLAQNLRQPLETFAWLATFQAVALVAHALYRNFAGSAAEPAPSVVRNLLARAGLYTPPTVGALWMMGLIGLFGQALASVSQGTVGKIGHGFQFVIWAPFLIPVLIAQMGPGYCDKKRHYPFLFAYASLIALIGIAANARGMMLSGFMTIGLIFLLRALRSASPVKASQIGKTVLIGVAVAAMAIPVSDLIIAMGIARKDRATSSPLKMVEDTFYYLTQPDQLKKSRDESRTANRFQSYDETYFESPLFGRLMETKFHDNAMYFGTRLSERDQDKLWDITGDFLWTTLPDPALNALKIGVDKNDMQFTIGDYLSHMNGAGNLGSYKTGSAFGHGLAMFGIYFPFVYFLICPVLFLVADILTYRSPQGTVLVSTLGMLGIWRLFQYGITAESLQVFFMMVVRGLPQNILIYLLTFWVANQCAKALASLAGAAHPQPPDSSLKLR